MIALYVTFTIAAYLLGPDLFSRFILGFVCSRRNIVQSKSEELTRAIGWAMLPLGAAIFWGWQSTDLRNHLHPSDWAVFIGGLYSEKFFNEHLSQFASALHHVYWANCEVLWRLYAIVTIFWVAVDIAIYNYGKIRASPLVQKYRLNKPLAYFIIPRVSEWHVLLSNMLLPNKDVAIHVDVLTKGDMLYKGRFAEKSLGPDGSLLSITLSDPMRFQREKYLKDKDRLAAKLASARDGEQEACIAEPERGSEVAEEKVGINKLDYWRAIHGRTFVILGSEITSINIRHSSPEIVKGEEFIRFIVQELNLQSRKHPTGVSVSIGELE